MNKNVLKRMIVIACATGALTGCAGVMAEVQTYDLPDGREVVCVVDSGGGVDCDWNKAE